jgi:hypothetical protein
MKVHCSNCEAIAEICLCSKMVTGEQVRDAHSQAAQMGHQTVLQAAKIGQIMRVNLMSLARWGWFFP